MKIRLLVAFALTAALLAVPSTAYAAPAGATVYYLSLGDSLAAGTQAGQFRTDQSYTDQLYAALKATRPKLQHVKLGCPGETSASLIAGGLPQEGRGAATPCDYPHGSQLAEAVSFLHAHGAFTVLVTIDIGANDALPCLATLDQACFAAAASAIGTNLPAILGALRAAAGPSVPIVGMNYYDPFLALWFQGPQGQAIAATTLTFVQQLNAGLGALYASAGVPVADVQTAFFTTDSTLIGGIPHNALVICALTWMCTSTPDIHPNATGYGVMAGAFLAVLP